MLDDNGCNLLSDCDNRVQGCHRVLEYRCDTFTADKHPVTGIIHLGQVGFRKSDVARQICRTLVYVLPKRGIENVNAGILCICQLLQYQVGTGINICYFLGKCRNLLVRNILLFKPDGKLLLAIFAPALHLGSGNHLFIQQVYDLIAVSHAECDIAVDFIALGLIGKINAFLHGIFQALEDGIRPLESGQRGETVNRKNKLLRKKNISLLRSRGDVDVLYDGIVLGLKGGHHRIIILQITGIRFQCTEPLLDRLLISALRFLALLVQLLDFRINLADFILLLL